MRNKAHMSVNLLDRIVYTDELFASKILVDKQTINLFDRIVYTAKQLFASKLLLGKQNTFFSWNYFNTAVNINVWPLYLFKYKRITIDLKSSCQDIRSSTKCRYIGITGLVDIYIAFSIVIQKQLEPQYNVSLYLFFVNELNFDTKKGSPQGSYSSLRGLMKLIQNCW